MNTKEITDPAAGVVSWEKDITILSNPLILKQMLIVIAGSGFFMAFILTVIFAATGDYRDIPAMLLVSLLTAAGLGLLLFLVTLIFFRNKMRVRFTIDETGVLWHTIDNKSKAAARLALFAGIVGRNPAAAGAGALSVSREKEFVRWKEVGSATFNPRQKIITLRNSWRPIMMLACLPDNYDQIATLIKSKTGEPVMTKKTSKRLPALAILRTALVTIAAMPLFMLSAYPFELDIFMPLILFLFALATVWLIPLFGWVVIISAVIIAVQVTVTGFSEFYYLYGADQAAFVLSYPALAFLAFYSRAYLRGKIRSLLMEE
jgi:hypothetical protein